MKAIWITVFRAHPRPNAVGANCTRNNWPQLKRNAKNEDIVFTFVLPYVVVVNDVLHMLTFAGDFRAPFKQHDIIDMTANYR